jgi:hypothetical protein
VIEDFSTVIGIQHRKATPVGLSQLALRQPTMLKGAGKGPPGFGCGEGTLAVTIIVGELALVPASNHLHQPYTNKIHLSSPHTHPHI